MKKITHKSELENLLSHAIVEGADSNVNIENKSLGRFNCQVEGAASYTKIRRNFYTEDLQVSIPFWRHEPSMVMVFQLNGSTFFRDKYNPFELKNQHHSLNYFNSYDCRNLLDTRSVQNDLTIILERDFYEGIVSDKKDETGSKIFEKIRNREEFNTLNSKQRMDAGIYGILQNIVNCPFSGDFKKTYINTQVKALLILQVFHFHALLTGNALIEERDLLKKDKEALHEIKLYLDDHFLNEASIEGLSKQFGINEFKLKFGFKRLFETSPIKYIQNKRMQFACRLLLETDEPIVEISDKLGYAHANNFTLAFRKKFGFTPQKYRNGSKFSGGWVA